MTKKRSFYVLLSGGFIFLVSVITRFLGFLELSVILSIFTLLFFIVGIIGFIIGLIKHKI